MLSIGGRLTEENWSSGILDILSAACDSLSIRFHRQLLKIRREAVKILVEALISSVDWPTF